MAYEVVMSYHLHMPSYFLGTFTEYPYLNTFSFQKTFYNISISSLDNPVACEMTSIATPNFFKLRALSFTPSL